MLKKRNWWRGLAAFLTLAVSSGGGYAGWRFFFPLESTEFLHRVELWKQGVQEFELTGVHGIKQDFCSDASPSGCTCIALIHGVGDNALTWRKLLQEPKTSWLQPTRLYAFDLPGSGETAAPAQKEGYQARRLAKQLNQSLIAEKSCSSWVVVGNSFGGWVASWMTLEGTANIQKLVLVGAAGLKVQASESRAASLLADPTVESMKEFQKRAYHQPREIPEPIWKSVVAKAKQGNSRQVLEAQVPEDFLDTYLPDLRKPTVVFWGASDRVILPAVGRQFTVLIPGAVYRETPACGHLPQKECPSVLLKALNEVLRYGSF